MSLTATLIQVAVSAAAGAAGGYLAAYIQWDVEKRRAKLERRRSLVDLWRKELVVWPEGEGAVVSHGGLSITHLSAYASLRPHLSAGCIQGLEGPRHGERVIDLGGGHGLRRRLIDEIARIEREWGLI